MAKYMAMYRGQKIQVEADTSYNAQQKAAQLFRAKKRYEVDVYLLETVHSPASIGS